MSTLKLSSVETCILAAYQKYLAGTTGDFPVATDDGKVNITCRISSTNFNCGFPGYRMSKGETDDLRQWCTTQPGSDPGSDRNWVFGFRGTSPTHPDSVNITLIDRTPYMFNFHVFLT